MSHARPPRKRSVAGRLRRKGANLKKPKGTSNIELWYAFLEHGNEKAVY